MSSSGTFVDRIDPFAKRSLKKKQKKSQGSSRYRTGGDVELTALPLLKGQLMSVLNHVESVPVKSRESVARESWWLIVSTRYCPVQ